MIAPTDEPSPSRDRRPRNGYQRAGPLDAVLTVCPLSIIPDGEDSSSATPHARSTCSCRRSAFG